ncbi:4Fe-4S binding protein [Oligoflexia bacterium]|nr:4Fe-4S binding protein [Oligoflexia bacterium]
MEKVVIDKDRCKGCELCVAFCPRDCLEMSDELNAQGYHPPRVTDAVSCTSCAMCANVCPEVALRIFRARKPKKKKADSKQKGGV